MSNVSSLSRHTEGFRLSDEDAFFEYRIAYPTPDVWSDLYPYFEDLVVFISNGNSLNVAHA